MAMAAARWGGGYPGGGDDAWGRGEAESEGVWERVVYQADDRGALERLMKRKGAAGGRNAAGPKPLIGEPQAAGAALGESAATNRGVSGVKFGWQGLVASDVAVKERGDTWQRAKWGLRWFDSPTADDWEDGFPDDHVDAQAAPQAADAAREAARNGREGDEAREAAQEGGREGEGGQGEYSRCVAEGLLARLSFMPAPHPPPPLPPLHPPALVPAASPLPAPQPCEPAAQPGLSTRPPVPARPPPAAPCPPSPLPAPPAAPRAPVAMTAGAMAAAAPIIPPTTGGKSAPSLASLLPPPLPHPASSSPPVTASQGGRQVAGKASAGRARQEMQGQAWEEGQGHSEGGEREGSRGGAAMGGLAQQLLQLTGAPPPLAHGGKGRGGRYRGKKEKVRA
ncbi:unnamed protein product [Closterium sp. Yama58-4]|nr:unnamed protein product [Closterium sp. Yama58-4]